MGWGEERGGEGRVLLGKPMKGLGRKEEGLGPLPALVSPTTGLHLQIPNRTVFPSVLTLSLPHPWLPPRLGSQTDWGRR